MYVEGTGTLPFSNQKTISQYLQCPMDDNTKANCGQYFQQVIDFVAAAESSGKRVLIHCQMGMR